MFLGLGDLSFFTPFPATSQSIALQTSLPPPSLSQMTLSQVPDSTKLHHDPKAAMRKAVSELLLPASSASTLDADLYRRLLSDLPSRWERLGDLALLPAASVTDPGWDRGEKGRTDNCRSNL